MQSTTRTLIGLVLISLLAGPGQAATDVKAVASDGPEIVRDAGDLVDVIRPTTPDDKDVTDTALVFTNRSNVGKRVKCVAFNKNGAPVGRAWLFVPGLGLRYALASDVANDLDFVGSVQCFVGADIIGSSILLAGGQLTDLPVENGSMTREGRRILFPLAATY